MGRAQDAAEEPRYGWVMVAVTFVLTGLTFGAASSLGVFLKPLSAEFGWSRGDVSFAYTMYGLAMFMGVLWGRVADRFGARPPALVAAAGMTVILLLLSGIAALWQFYALFFLFGALGHAAVNSPLYANVGFWFARNKGLALGVAGAGGAFGQAVVPLVAQLLVSAGGWRTAYTVLALAYVAIALPLALLVREAPERRAASRPGGAPAQAAGLVLSPVETTSWLCGAVVFCCMCMAVPIVHVVPLCSDLGYQPTSAAGVLTALMVAAACGRVFGGWVADRVGALPAYMLFSLGQTSLVAWFPYIDPLAAMYGFAAVFGFVYSGVMTNILVCVREMIPAEVAARSMGFVVFFAWIGMGLGGYQGGLAFDLSGGYQWSYAMAAFAGAANLTILIAFWFRVRGRTVAALPA